MYDIKNAFDTTERFQPYHSAIQTTSEAIQRWHIAEIQPYHYLLLFQQSKHRSYSCIVYMAHNIYLKIEKTEEVIT